MNNHVIDQYNSELKGYRNKKYMNIFEDEDDRSVRFYYATFKKDKSIKLKPTIPDTFMVRNGFEDNTVKRIEVFESVDGALTALSKSLAGQTVYIHTVDAPAKNIVSNKTILQEGYNNSAKLTRQVWIIGTEVDSKYAMTVKVSAARDKPLVYSYGDANEYKDELYAWRYQVIDEAYSECYSAGAATPFLVPANNSQVIDIYDHVPNELVEGDIVVSIDDGMVVSRNHKNEIMSRYPIDDEYIPENLKEFIEASKDNTKTLLFGVYHNPANVLTCESDFYYKDKVIDELVDNPLKQMNVMHDVIYKLTGLRVEIVKCEGGGGIDDTYAIETDGIQTPTDISWQLRKINKIAGISFILHNENGILYSLKNYITKSDYANILLILRSENENTLTESVDSKYIKILELLNKKMKDLSPIDNNYINSFYANL